MKKKIALLLAAAMTVSMLPMSAMAGSTNTISVTANVKTNEAVKVNGEFTQLQIKPLDTIASNSSIVLDLENGEYNEEYFTECAYKAHDGESFDTVYSYNANDPEAGLKAYVGAKNERELPYKLKYINKTSMEVQLYPIDAKWVNQNNSGGANEATKGTPVYQISLPVDATDDEGDIKVTVDANSTTVTGGGSYTIAKVTSGSGSTTSSVVSSDIKTHSGNINVPQITVKEDVSGTFTTEGGTVKVKANGPYKFKAGTVTLKSGVNAAVPYTYKDKDGKEITQTSILASQTIADGANEVVFTLTKADIANIDKDKLSSLTIDGLVMVPNNDEKNYGDVYVTVSGTDITSQQLKVGTRADYGFNLTAMTEAPTIFAGRSPLRDDDLDDDDFKTAKFRFEETTPGAWLTSRKLEFTVPDGVKIIGMDVDKVDKLNQSNFEGGACLSNDGQTLRIEKDSDVFNGFSRNDAAYVDMYLYISTDAAFTGDVTVAVSGAGVEADTITPVTVAKVVTPITVEATETKAAMGYQNIDTSDITITENAAGALLDGNTVKLAIDSLYGSKELGFADADNLTLTTDGNLEAKNFKVSDGEMSFKVDTASYSTPSTVKITGVQVGTTRSVPYGAYDLKVYGDAVVNNYDDDVDTYSSTICSGSVSDPDTTAAALNKDIDDSSTHKLDMFDVNEGFKFAGYLNVDGAGSDSVLTKKVEVTIGEKSVTMDGEKIDTDVAAYIQTSSNSTMVPLRVVALALGVDSANAANPDETNAVNWDANSKTATIVYGQGSTKTVIQFQAGSNNMNVNGSTIAMANGVTAEITDGRMFVPFRALGQAFGVSVSWDADTKTAIYNA